MPTQKKRIAAYIPDKVYSEFEQFKSERGIKGDSEALTVILSEFLKVSQEMTYEVSQRLPDINTTILNYLSPLESRLAQ